MYRDKLAKIILLTILFPLIVYIFGSCVMGYIPPEESYMKAPFQMERAFNKKMEQYGMSIDFSSSSFECFQKKYSLCCVKTVPITCADGSNITCTIYTYGTRHTSLITWIRFEQKITKTSEENHHIEQILAFVLQEFETFSYNRPDTPTSDYHDEYETYNSALEKCRAFLKSSDEILEMQISSYSMIEEQIIVRRSNDGESKLILEYGALVDTCPTLEDEES